MKATYTKYRNKKWFSIGDLAELMLKHNRDGMFDHTTYEFIVWLDKKYEISDKKLKQKIANIVYSDEMGHEIIDYEELKPLLK